MSTQPRNVLRHVSVLTVMVSAFMDMVVLGHSSVMADVELPQKSHHPQNFRTAFLLSNYGIGAIQVCIQVSTS